MKSSTKYYNQPTMHRSPLIRQISDNAIAAACPICMEQIGGGSSHLEELRLVSMQICTHARSTLVLLIIIMNDFYLCCHHFILICYFPSHIVSEIRAANALSTMSVWYTISEAA